MPVGSILASLAFLTVASASDATSHSGNVVCHRQLTTANLKDVRISGMLERRRTYGPPYWGERPKTDSRYSYWVVKLDAPIMVVIGVDVGMPSQTVTAREMQIQLGSKLGNVDPAFRGKHVIVQGMVNTQIFITDMTPVVINASSLVAGGPIPCEG